MQKRGVAIGEFSFSVSFLSSSWKRLADRMGLAEREEGGNREEGERFSAQNQGHRSSRRRLLHDKRRKNHTKLVADRFICLITES